MVGNPLVDIALVVIALIAVVATIGFLGGGNLYDRIGSGGTSIAHGGEDPPEGSKAAGEQRDTEVRQMLGARNERRARMGEPPLDIDLETARLLGAGPAPFSHSDRGGEGDAGPAGAGGVVANGPAGAGGVVGADGPAGAGYLAGADGSAGTYPGSPSEVRRHDPELVEELRQLATARNQRRARRGEPPLDVDAEVQRRLTDLDD